MTHLNSFNASEKYEHLEIKYELKTGSTRNQHESYYKH